MAIDSSIYGQIQQFKPESQLNSLANILQVQGAQQANQLNSMKMDEYQRGVQDQNALRSLLGTQGFDISKPEWQQRLMSTSPKAGMDFIKQHVEGVKAKAEADTKTFELAQKRYNTYKTAIGSLAQDPALTKEKVLASGQELVNMGILPPELFQQASTGLPDDPVMLRQKLTEGLKSQMTPEQIFTVFSPKVSTVDNGQQIFRVDDNPNSPTFGQRVGAGPVQKVATPGEQLHAQTSRENAAATRAVAQATRDAAQIKANQDTEMKLGDDYRAQSKNFKEVGEAYRQINNTLDKATTSPAATLAAATKFMKLLDPGSVVRESELGMALAASGVFDRAANYVNTLQNGRVLTANQVQDFKNITQQIYAAAQQGQQSIDAHYTKQAKAYGLRPEMVVQNLGQNEKPAVDLSKLPTGKPKTIDFGSMK